jgi:hypothetical protein
VNAECKVANGSKATVLYVDISRCYTVTYLMHDSETGGLISVLSIHICRPLQYENFCPYQIVSSDGALHKKWQIQKYSSWRDNNEYIVNFAVTFMGCSQNQTTGRNQER